jgi:cytochrome b
MVVPVLAGCSPASGNRWNMRDVKVWDIGVRIGHWLLVLCFAVAYLTEGEPEWLHTWAGYVIATVVALRVVWGLVGPRHARFTDFVRGPSAVLGYLRDLISFRAPRYLGHSPAGGAMVVALLLMLAVTTGTGMVYFAKAEGGGPLAGWVAPGVTAAGVPVTDRTLSPGDRKAAKRQYRMLKEVHEVAANLTLLLVLLHLGGVALASLVHRENLPRSMVTGRKRE